MIFGIGTDLVDVRHIEKALKTFGARFETRLFTPYEQSLSHKQSNPALYYGKRFAAKEAFVKALGTGIGMAVFWKDVEVRNNALGKLFLQLAYNLQESLRQTLPLQQKIQLDLSLTDEYPYAQAFVVISYWGSLMDKKIPQRARGRWEWVFLAIFYISAFFILGKTHT